MYPFHPSVRRHSTIVEGAFENLRRCLIVVVSIPVSNLHPDFDAAAFNELVLAIKDFSKADRSITHIRVIYEMTYEEDLRSS